MAIIKGYVYYDPMRSLGTAAGIKGVRVVLRDIINKTNCEAVTDTGGRVVFHNVPTGKYTLIEAHKESDKPSEVNFTKYKAFGRKPRAKDPSRQLIVGLEEEVTRLDSVNTNEYNFSLTQEEIREFRFFNAPVIDIPLKLHGVSKRGRNLFLPVKNGTFGTIPKNSYGVSTLNNFVYKNARFCKDDFLSVTNLVSSCNNCWPITDHTNGLRSGQFLALKGCKENTVFLRQTVSVTKNTNYLFAFWTASFFNPAKTSDNLGSRLAIAIRQSKTNKLIYKKEFCPLKQQEIVTWIQLGCIFNSLQNESVVVELVNLNNTFAGNAYAIDDLTLHKVHLETLLQTVSKLAKETESVFDLTLYFENCSKLSSEELCLSLELPEYADFMPKSFRVGVCENLTESVNPLLGVGLNSIAPKSSTKVRMKMVSREPLRKKDIQINLKRKSLYTKLGEQYTEENT